MSNKKHKTYSKRVWLNKNSSPSTGSVVAFYGDVKWESKPELCAFLEIASCHEKARLHMSRNDNMNDFIAKMKLLNKTINDFILFLEANKES